MGLWDRLLKSAFLQRKKTCDKYHIALNKFYSFHVGLGPRELCIRSNVHHVEKIFLLSIAKVFSTRQTVDLHKYSMEREIHLKNPYPHP